MLGTILGWSSFGLAARCWQLAIMKRNLTENLGGHALSMGAFGTLGYFYYGWEQRVNEMLEQKKSALRQAREQRSGQQQQSEDGDE